MEKANHSVRNGSNCVERLELCPSLERKAVERTVASQRPEQGVPEVGSVSGACHRTHSLGALA